MTIPKSLTILLVMIILCTSIVFGVPLSFNVSDVGIEWIELTFNESIGTAPFLDINESYLNATITTIGDAEYYRLDTSNNPLTGNVSVTLSDGDAEFRLDAGLNHDSCFILQESDIHGFKFCYDGSGINNWIVTDMYGNLRMQLDRDDGQVTFYNDTTVNGDIYADNFIGSFSYNDTHVAGDDVYLYNDSTTMYFNETKLNDTIDSKTSDIYVNETGDTMTGNLNINANLTVDTDTLYVDSTNDRVGIGTTTPTAKLDVTGGNLHWEYDGVGTASVDFGRAASNSGSSITFKNSVGKAGGLISGTVGTGVAFDNSGTFNIIAEDRTDIDNDNMGTGDIAMSVANSTGGYNIGMGGAPVADSKLKVYGSEAPLTLESSTARNWINLQGAGSTNLWAYGHNILSTGEYGIYEYATNTEPFRIMPSNLDRKFVIDPNKIGIRSGGVLPLGNEKIGIEFSYDGLNYLSSIDTSFDSVTTHNNRMFFRVSDKTSTGKNDVLTLTGDQKVGIATTDPQNTLHVVGDANITGNLTVEGDILNTMPHLFGISDTTQNMIAINTWQEIVFNYSLGDSYGFTIAGNCINVTKKGHYMAIYEAHFVDDSPAPDSKVAISITQNGAEVEGSYSEISLSKQAEENEVTTFGYIRANVSDILCFEWVGSDIDIRLYEDNMWATQNVTAKGFINWVHPD